MHNYRGKFPPTAPSLWTKLSDPAVTNKPCYNLTVLHNTSE